MTKKVPNPNGYSGPRYTKTVAQEICNHVLQGYAYEDLRRTNANRYPRLPQLYKWCKDYPEFGSEYYVAAQAGTMYLVDDLVSIADAPLPDEDRAASLELKRRSLQISARRAKISTMMDVFKAQQTKLASPILGAPTDDTPKSIEDTGTIKVIDYKDTKDTPKT